MAKRFTDTEKWKDAWFCSLSEKEKLFWVYLVDNCDHAGIWRVNWPLVKFYITGFDFKPEVFNGRIVYLSGEKWFISKFIDFQYNGLKALNPLNRTHKSIVNILTKEGAYKGLTRAIQARKDTGIDKGLNNITNINKDTNINNTTNVVQEVASYFYSSYKKAFGKDYIASFGKEGAIFKDLLKKIPIDEIKNLIDIYLATPDKFVEDGGYSVGIFKSRINSLRIEKKTGKFSEKTIKSAIALKSWMEKKDA